MTKSIRELAGRTALWRQPSPLRQEFEMVAGDEVVATLRWRKPGGTTAVARSPDGTWSFKASGFTSPRATVRLPNSEYDFAVFRGDARGGVMESLGEQRFTWRCVDFWQNAWAFFDSEGDKLLQLKPEVQANKVTGTVELTPKASARQEVGFLVVFAWYLLVLLADDVTADNPPTG